MRREGERDEYMHLTCLLVLNSISPFLYSSEPPDLGNDASRVGLDLPIDQPSVQNLSLSIFLGDFRWYYNDIKTNQKK